MKKTAKTRKADSEKKKATTEIVPRDRSARTGYRHIIDEGSINGGMVLGYGGEAPAILNSRTLQVPNCLSKCLARVAKTHAVRFAGSAPRRACTQGRKQRYHIQSRVQPRTRFRGLHDSFTKIILQRDIEMFQAPKRRPETKNSRDPVRQAPA